VGPSELGGATGIFAYLYFVERSRGSLSHDHADMVVCPSGRDILNGDGALSKAAVYQNMKTLQTHGLRFSLRKYWCGY